MSKIMELADHYAICNAVDGDGVTTHKRTDEARSALAAEVEKIELLATATHIVMAERDALREKLASVEKDAARYRWLRHHRAFETESWLSGCTPEEYDVRVDQGRGEI